MTYKNAILSCIMLLTLGAALWTSLFTFKQKTMGSHATDVAHTPVLPDAYMEEVNTTIMDKQGKIKMKVFTPKMQHFSQNDRSYLTAPLITLYRHTAQPWYISAKTAIAFQGMTQIDFWQQVVIHHPGDESSPETIIKTTKLSVLPDKQIAATAAAITMNQPNLTIDAIGMHADMDKGNIKLLSAARGEYAPNR